jgi:hypothetical protein
MGLSEMLDQVKAFSSNSYVQGGKEFLNSNSIIAKFAFLILILIVFMLLLSLGSFILAMIFSNKHNPILIDGMINSTQMLIIPQNPSKKGAIPIYRSDNAREGLEFTWSVWIFVDDISYKETGYKHIFHKGNETISGGLAYPNNGPGLYIKPVTNTNTTTKGNTAQLLVKMNTFSTIDNDVTVDNLPLNKWVNIIIRVTKQKQLDVYINGTLTKRKMLDGIPRQNYGDVFVSMNGGFSGNTSDLRYFESAIGTNKIQSIVEKGPNTKAAVGSLDFNKNVENKYLSTRWYLTTATTI